MEGVLSTRPTLSSSGFKHIFKMLRLSEYSLDLVEKNCRTMLDLEVLFLS